jgi:hypothetical protein
MREHTPVSTYPTPQSAEGLAQWRRLTRQGNTAFAAGRLDLAALDYTRALQLATTLAAGPALTATPDDCLAALVVAHHNLADTFERRGDDASALDHLCNAHDALIRIACDAGTRDDIRLHAIRHLTEARIALLRWQRAHGQCTRTDALLRASATVAFPPFDGARH